MYNSFLHHWMVWTGIGSVTIALIAACIFFPLFGGVLVSFLKPIAEGLGEWVKLWMADMATGLRLMLSSIAGLIFCTTLFFSGAAVGHWYFASPADHAVELAMKDLHDNFKCYPREAKRAATTWYNPFTWF